MNWAMEKSILAACTPPLRNKVRKPAGFPTPFGWAYPVLDCAGVECGRIPSANWGRALPFPSPLTQSGNLRVSRHLSGWAYPVLFCVEVECGHKPSAVRRVSEANLKVERFGEKAERLFRKISRPKHRSSSKSWFGAETGEGARGPLPRAPKPQSGHPQARSPHAPPRAP